MANQHCKQTVDSINIRKASDLKHFSHVENDKCFYPSEKKYFMHSKIIKHFQRPTFSIPESLEGRKILVHIFL